MFDSKRLAKILNNFRKIHLLVVGDLMLDRFIWGEVERLSPEAPVRYCGYVQKVRAWVALPRWSTTSEVWGHRCPRVG